MCILAVIVREDGKKTELKRFSKPNQKSQTKPNQPNLVSKPTIIVLKVFFYRTILLVVLSVPRSIGFFHP